jgi:hypothetical protein
VPVSWLPDVTAWMKQWSAYYGNHAALSTAITYLHLAGLVVGGGAAVTTDRQILRAWHRGGERRPTTLLDVAAVHTFVVGGLFITMATGLLMMFADFETFKASPLFWWKMAGVGLLVVNGGVLSWAERLARRTEGARGWPVLGVVSVVSMALWMATLFLGTYLKTAA